MWEQRYKFSVPTAFSFKRTVCTVARTFVSLVTLDFILFRPLRDVIPAPPAISATVKLTQINLRLLKPTVVRYALKVTTAQLALQSR